MVRKHPADSINPLVPAVKPNAQKLEQVCVANYCSGATRPNEHTQQLANENKPGIYFLWAGNCKTSKSI